MDPLGTALAVLDICDRIYVQVEKASANKARCKRLGQRIEIIQSAIKDLIEKTLRQLDEMKKTYYFKSLKSLLMTLEMALELIGNFSVPEIWMIKIVKAGFYNDDFLNIYERLSEDLAQLNLGLNVQILNTVEDKEDSKIDAQTFREQQHAILEQNKEYFEELMERMQSLQIQGEEQAKIIGKKVESMRTDMNRTLKKMCSGKQKKTPFSQKILIHFHELEINRLLGIGSFGSVYQGKWLGQDVAIKMIERELTETVLKEFNREVKIMKRLRSDFVMPLYAVCNEPGHIFLVMKYMNRGSLRSVLDRRTHFTERQRDRLIFDIALGLNYLHNTNIIHRDLKSANVLMDSENRARVADFGLSKMGSTQTSSFERTKDIEWLAPEILLSPWDNRAFTKASDVYSFGVVVWEILTGKKPYDGKSLAEVTTKIQGHEHEIIPDTIPEHYKKLLKDCWNKLRSARPSMSEIIVLLRENQNSEIYYKDGVTFEQQEQFEKALESYNIASDLGYSEATRCLALLYLRGLGCVRDSNFAHQLLIQAASAGNSKAMRNLAYQFEKGDGISKDIVQAHFWYEKAAAAGDEYAIQKCQRWSEQSFLLSSSSSTTPFISSSSSQFAFQPPPRNQEEGLIDEAKQLIRRIYSGDDYKKELDLLENKTNEELVIHIDGLRKSLSEMKITNAAGKERESPQRSPSPR